MLKTVSLLTFIFYCTYSGFAQKSSIAELNKPYTGIIECTAQPFIAIGRMESQAEKLR